MSLTYEPKCLIQLNINWNISLFEREWEDVIGIENSRIESNNKNYTNAISIICYRKTILQRYSDFTYLLCIIAYYICSQQYCNDDGRWKLISRCLSNALRQMS